MDTNLNSFQPDQGKNLISMAIHDGYNWSLFNRAPFINNVPLWVDHWHRAARWASCVLYFCTSYMYECLWRSQPPNFQIVVRLFQAEVSAYMIAQLITHYIKNICMRSIPLEWDHRAVKKNVVSYCHGMSELGNSIPLRKFVSILSLQKALSQRR